MSDSGPFGPPGDDDPFRQMGFFGDLARMLSQQSTNSWETARQFAISIATEGRSEPNVDPADRIQFEQLARVAELQVAEATGLTVSHTGRGIAMVPVNRMGWADKSTEAYKDLLEALAGSLGAGGGLFGAMAPDPDDPDAAADPFAAMLAPLMNAIGPMMLGMTAGSMLGHLARRSLGQYDLPVPRPGSDQLLVVVPNLDEFGREWSLPRDDVRLWVCLHEVAHHAVLGIPHVGQRLTDLLRRYAGGFKPDPSGLDSRIEGLELDITNPQSLAELQRQMGDPEMLLGAIRSPAQSELLPGLEALVAVIVGYVDWVMDSVGTNLLGSYHMVTEALRRRRVAADPSDRFVGKLLGLELSQAQYERGGAFVTGVVERAGPSAPERLWHSERELPTPAEVDAPGLWLARIDLPEQ
ncbi:MAG: zinc-dependent metalloprotease [Acidimicrobiia bacterium]